MRTRNASKGGRGDVAESSSDSELLEGIVPFDGAGRLLFGVVDGVPALEDGIVSFEGAGPLLFGLHDADFELPPGFVPFGTTARLIFEIQDGDERAA